MMANERGIGIRVAPVAAAAMLALCAGAAAAAEIVSDPAAVAPELAVVTELWRAGGEDDEVFFGNVGAPCLDADGNLYLMDAQLSQAHVFSPAGEFIGTVGREGDGPGEVRSPSDMFIRADGVVGLVQGFPGRIVLLNPDDTPAGQVSYSVGEGAQGQFVVLNRAFALPEGLCLVGTRMTMGASSKSMQTFFVDVCTPEGVRRTNLLEKQYEIDYADFLMDEASMDFVWTRIAVGRDGRIHFAPSREEYVVRTFTPGGEPVRTVRCEFASPTRDEGQRTNARRIHEAIGAYYPVPPKRITIEDTDPAVGGLWATDDGRLWVQSSRSEQDAPDGAWLVLDVFGPDGRLQRRLGLPGGYDPRNDAVMVLDGARYLVVRGALSAWLTQQAVAQEAAAAEADPLEVVCYRIEK